ELPRFLYFLRPLPAERVREVIVGPAEVTGIAFESEPMIETLAGAMANAEGGLPLLQFALAQLWDSRDRGRRIIPEAALAALGGVAGAVARHAEGVLQTLLPAQRRLARRPLVQLVTADDTSVRRNETELVSGDEAAGATLDALVRGRLLVARDGEGGSVYEL